MFATWGNAFSGRGGLGTPQDIYVISELMETVPETQQLEYQDVIRKDIPTPTFIRIFQNSGSSTKNLGLIFGNAPKFGASEREPHEPMNANWGSGIDLEIPAESDGANGFSYFKEKDESKSSCDKYIYVIDIREYESSDSMKLWFIVVWMYLRHQCDTPLHGIF